MIKKGQVATRPLAINSHANNMPELENSVRNHDKPMIFKGKYRVFGDPREG
jgi:hypothetical protein